MLVKVGPVFIIHAFQTDFPSKLLWQFISLSSFMVTPCLMAWDLHLKKKIHLAKIPCISAAAVEAYEAKSLRTEGSQLAAQEEMLTFPLDLKGGRVISQVSCSSPEKRRRNRLLLHSRELQIIPQVKGTKTGSGSLYRNPVPILFSDFCSSVGCWVWPLFVYLMLIQDWDFIHLCKLSIVI